MMNPMRLTIAYTTFLLFWVNLFAQQQITDFSYRKGDKSSNPQNFIEYNGKVIFSAYTESFGQEYWVSDGTPDNAQLLKDIHPGKRNSIIGALEENAVVLNGLLYFTATDGLSAGELWKTDGTSSGTEKVTDFLNSHIRRLTLIGNHIFFTIQKGFSLELWKNDGTSTGTELVKGNMSIWDVPSFEDKVGNTFIFTFRPYGSNKTRVWRSDGTDSGTFPLTATLDGHGAGPSGSPDLTQYILYKDELYFVARTSAVFPYPNTVGIIKTDGSLNGTIAVKSVHPGTRLITQAAVIELNDKLYFSFFEKDYKRLFIWESDGTESGTKLVYDQSGVDDFVASRFEGHNNQLIFCGPGQGGTSLTMMNVDSLTITDLGPVLTVNETSTSAFYKEAWMLKLADGKFFISIPTINRINKGWVLDLNQNPNQLEHLLALDDHRAAFIFNNSLYFSKYEETTGIELWRSDCTEAGTVFIDNINKYHYGIQYPELVNYNDLLVFGAHDSTVGYEPRIYNDDLGQLSLLKDIYAGSGHSNPLEFKTHNGQLYFVARDSAHGFEPWKSDGTTQGTVLLEDIVPGPERSYPGLFTSHQRDLYFLANIYSNNKRYYYLYKTDGSTTTLVKALGVNQFNNPIYLEAMISGANTLYLVDNSKRIWISDGTDTGTTLVKEMGDCKNFTLMNGELFFSGRLANSGDFELWKTDGTAAGTQLVKDLDTISSSPEHLFAINNELYFTASTSAHGRELWKSDGTEAGTAIVADIFSGTKSGLQEPGFCILNDELYFRANNGASGPELWKTDGTQAGTEMVKDVFAGELGSFPSEMYAIDNYLYFQANDDVHGVELWYTNGQSDSTLLLADIEAGNASSSPKNMIEINNKLFFVANTKASGEQIWKWDVTTTGLSEEGLAKQINLVIYPNVARDMLYFKTEEKVDKFSIYRIDGRQIYDESKPEAMQIDISRFSAGIYLIIFDIAGAKIAKRFIKE